MATSRKDIRDAIATILEAGLVGDGLPVKTVSAHKQESLEGITPLVVVLSRGSEREAFTYQGNQSSFRFLVQVWVLQEATGWTQAQAEDALDDIEKRVAAIYEDNRTKRAGSGQWEKLAYDGQTRVFEVSVAGVPYYVESIPTVVMLAQS
jgi:hypothetical protein